MRGEWESHTSCTGVVLGECAIMNDHLSRIADALERIANALEAQQRDAGRNCTLDCFGEGGK